MQKVMLIANRHAGSVSDRTMEVIVKALQADFKLEEAVTARREHGGELAADAVDRDFDAVLAFGGDGTINEVAQGLVGTDVALGVLPGGSTNVMARSLGIPTAPVDATAFVASRLRSGTKRRINVGQINHRYFLFCAGMGLDAEVVRRVEADPEKKRERREWVFVSNALRAGLGAYRGKDPVIDLRFGAEQHNVMTAVVCNGRPFTYFKRFPVDVCPGAQLDAGFDVFGLKKLSTATAARLAWSLFVSRSHTHWKRSVYEHDIDELTASSSEALPVQVDGDYVGDWDSAKWTLKKQALDLLI